MSNFINIEFSQGEGVFFEAFIADEDRKFFLELYILENMTGKKSIDNRGVALAMFHSIRNRIHRMCTVAHIANPNWPPGDPLKLSQEHIR
jgi:hypothetical protein